MLSRLSVRPSSLHLSSRMATQRVSMVSQHLSSTSASSASPSTSSTPSSKPQDGSPSSTAPVLFEAEHSLRKVILNRPKALNSLNDEMVELILPLLNKYEQSDLANVILIKSNSKHFCAGGDVVCEFLSLPLSLRAGSRSSQEALTDPCTLFSSCKVIGQGVGMEESQRFLQEGVHYGEFSLSVCPFR